MVKVLEQGKVPEQDNNPLWEGMKIRCPRCKALYELDKDDKLYGKRQDGMSGPVYFNCLTTGCKTEMKITLPRVEPVVYRDSAPRMDVLESGRLSRRNEND